MPPDLPLAVAVLTTWDPWSRAMSAALAEPQVAAELAAFSASRVDADARPDLARRLAPGGFPALALLAPDGTPLVATGYAPPRTLREFLRAAALQWHTRAPLIVAEARKARQAAQELSRLRPAPGPADLGFVRAAVADLVETADPSGGWGDSPPQLRAASLHLLARHRDLPGAAEVLDGALKRLGSGPLGQGASGTYLSSYEDGEPPDTVERPAELAELLEALTVAEREDLAGPLARRLRLLRGPGGEVPVAATSVAGEHLATAESTLRVAEALRDLPAAFDRLVDSVTGLVRHTPGDDSGRFYLPDQASAVGALAAVDAARARALADLASEAFFSRPDGAWHDRIGPTPDPAPLHSPVFDAVENAGFARAVLTAGSGQADRARTVLSGFVDAFRGQGHAAAPLALAISASLPPRGR